MESKSKQHEIAEHIRIACIKAAKKGFMDASMNGLCANGKMEVAISTQQHRKDNPSPMHRFWRYLQVFPI